MSKRVALDVVLTGLVLYLLSHSGVYGAQLLFRLLDRNWSSSPGQLPFLLIHSSLCLAIALALIRFRNVLQAWSGVGRNKYLPAERDELAFWIAVMGWVVTLLYLTDTISFAWQLHDFRGGIVLQSFLVNFLLMAAGVLVIRKSGWIADFIIRSWTVVPGIAGDKEG